MTGLQLHLTKRKVRDNELFSCILLDTRQLQPSKGFRSGPDPRDTAAPVSSVRENVQPSMVPEPCVMKAPKLSGCGTEVLFRQPPWQQTTLYQQLAELSPWQC